MLPQLLRLRPLLFVAVPLVTGAVWLAVETQRSAADHAIEEVQVAQTMLTAMLDQRVSTQAYLETGRSRFLAQYRERRTELEAALTRARQLVTAGEAEELEGIEVLRRRSREWQAQAENAMARRLPPGSARVSDTLARDARFNRFRSAHRGFVEDRRDERESRSRTRGARRASLDRPGAARLPRIRIRHARRGPVVGTSTHGSPSPCSLHGPKARCTGCSSGTSSGS